ncbi:MAG: hypothetical protein ACRED5_14925 [Propylenella sp.]
MSDREFDDAVKRATRLLAVSRAPVIAGLGADAAGVVAAYRLAEKLGAPIDHGAADSALRHQAVLQDFGLMLVSPGEARNRADTFLIVGDRPAEARPDLIQSLITDRPGDGSAGTAARRIVAIASHAPSAAQGVATVELLEAPPPNLPGVLGALRARAGGRPLASGYGAETIDSCVATLRAASFGVAIWSPEELDSLAIEMLAGLIQDLNASTRWSGLSVSADPTITGAAMAFGWMSGQPLRSSFGRGRAENDPWRCEARRMVESGEADALVWISAFGEPPPHWADAVPTVVVADASVHANGAAAVLRVGRPGVDHAGVLYDHRTGTLAEFLPNGPSGAQSVAEALTRIVDGLDAR